MIGGRGFNTRSVTFNLIMLNVLAFLAAQLFGENQMGLVLNQKLGLYLPTSEAFKPYQIITHMFMHGSFMHLLFNMYALWIFGSVLEEVWGAKRYLIYYLACALGAAVLYSATRYWEISQLAPIYQQAYLYVPVVGASGAVFGLLLGYGVLFPNNELYLMFIPFPIKAKYFVMGYGAIELFGGLARTPGDNVAHFAHLGGMLFGYILIRFWQKNSNDFY